MILGVESHNIPPDEMLAASNALARRSHRNQRYGNLDYFEGHIVPIVSLIARMGYAPEYQATGYLHDVPEDANLTPEYFERFQPNIPTCVTKAAFLLDKRGHSSHQDYLRALATSPLAVVGKFADSTVNLSYTAIKSPSLSSQKLSERISEYAGNIAFLTPLLPSPDSRLF